MSYAITIRRDAPISYDEWLRVAQADPSLVPAGEAEWNTDAGGAVRYVLFEWLPPADTGAAAACFSFFDGCVSIDHAHDAYVAKVVELARKLNAQAIGDDGEEYGPGPDGKPPRETPAARAPWYKRLFG